jgi:hypothetical protein
MAGCDLQSQVLQRARGIYKALASSVAKALFGVCSLAGLLVVRLARESRRGARSGTALATAPFGLVGCEAFGLLGFVVADYFDGIGD